MRLPTLALLLLSTAVAPVIDAVQVLAQSTRGTHAQTSVVVFVQPGFPTIASDPLDVSTLQAAFTGEGGAAPRLLDLAALRQSGSLDNADLLVLPYGSALPADAWPQIHAYVAQGGNLLVVGGQPLQVPVRLENGAYLPERAQDSYARSLDFRHSYEVPVPHDARFTWKAGYTWNVPRVQARHYFAIEGRLDGLGYMQDATGLLVAAPVIVADHAGGNGNSARVVALDFDPEPGYWKSADGVALLRTAATFAERGTTDFSIETLFSSLRPGELPQITAHLRAGQQPHDPGASVSVAGGMAVGGPADPMKAGRGADEVNGEAGEIKVELRRMHGPGQANHDARAGKTDPLDSLDQSTLVDQATLAVHGPGQADLAVPFHKPLAPGFYTVSASYVDAGTQRAFYRNGFFVEEREALASGPALGVEGDFLSLGGKPFFPVGTNYFTTEENGWDFSGPRNAWVWEKDFAEMEQHGVSFVRTGVWMPNAKFVESATGQVNERFLRNLEAYLAAAQRHHIAINFTLFAFAPHSGSERWGGNAADASAVEPNPYLDAAMVRGEQAYVRSVVARFGDVPWLSWDLINEPSFSNPHHIFHGNYPNNDPAEQRAWHQWLAGQYGSLTALASAWSTTPEELGSFDAIPLPALADLNYDRYGNAKQVRAVDYNLFAQAMFAKWVRGMVATIREAEKGTAATGASSARQGQHRPREDQLINVGQDEGGVTDRVLNQFYADAGVSFTTNHTYWQDDALLWDSVAAKRPGTPNITGETGYQPAWAPDGRWRFDELTGLGLTERKWALGFAAGSSGAMQWDWAREVDFGMQRSDGSAKVWENMMRDLGRFAQEAAPYAAAAGGASTGLVEPEVAIVLPESYQLSTGNGLALESQQRAVRAMFAGAGQSAYAVGEYSLGTETIARSKWSGESQAGKQGGVTSGASGPDLLGTPRLILLPAPGSLTDAAWQVILAKVQAGATLLASGAFLDDAHGHDTGRQQAIPGLVYKVEPLLLRDQQLTGPVAGPAGTLPLTYGGLKIIRLAQGVLPGGASWQEIAVGRGKILYSTLPIEANDNVESVAAIYRYALHVAGAAPVYTTGGPITPGITIAPTRFPQATLYVLTSEASATASVSLHDVRSGKNFRGSLEPGRAALLLVGADGRLITTYHWEP